MTAVHQPRKSKSPDLHTTPLTSYKESDHVYCWQILFNGHWCGATPCDRWLRSEAEIVALMKHCTHPHRIVERPAYQTELRYGPVLHN